MIEALVEQGVDISTDTANKIYENRETPIQLREMIKIKIPKMEGTPKCEQHRPISITKLLV